MAAPSAAQHPFGILGGESDIEQLQALSILRMLDRLEDGVESLEAAWELRSGG